MERRQQVYLANQAQEEIFAQLKRKAEVAYTDARALVNNGKNVSNFSQLKASYDSAMNAYIDASENTDISRDSYNRSIFYTAKMNQSAAIANSMLS